MAGCNTQTDGNLMLESVSPSIADGWMHGNTFSPQEMKRLQLGASSLAVTDLSVTLPKKEKMMLSNDDVESRQDRSDVHTDPRMKRGGRAFPEQLLQGEVRKPHVSETKRSKHVQCL